MSDCFALKGNVIYAPRLGELTIRDNSFVVCKDGYVEGLFDTLPVDMGEIAVISHEGKMIIPGLIDLHLHAPQYAYRGLGMDMELLEWLSSYAFPEEAKYQNMEYAKKAYDIFAQDLKKSATTRACIYGTIYTESNLLLMELLEQTGQCFYVGKVNMDRNSPSFYCENSAEDSIYDTKRFIEESQKRFQNVYPIITPRFIPTCTDELLKGLGVIQKEGGLMVQSHLSENQAEIKWVGELCPWSDSYTDAYDKSGVFAGQGKTLMAHCVYLEEEEIEIMKNKNAFAVHCPQSNTNLASGIAPVRRYLEKGMRVGLGTDVAGGFSLSMFRAMADCIMTSKLYWRLQDTDSRPINMKEAFYLATKAGGEFFGKTGSFEKGYEFDAVVIKDDMISTAMELSTEQRLERLIYLSEQAEVVDKYVKGRKIQ